MAIHGGCTKLTLRTKSVAEFKVAKARSYMTLRDSKDPVVKSIQPDVKSRRKYKWTSSVAVEEAESRLKHKEMVGAT